MSDWVSFAWTVFTLIWWRACLGVALLAFASVAGWQMSTNPSLAPVRFIRWWVLHALLPLLRGRSWFGRAAAIYANNMTILVAVVAMAAWTWAVILGIAVIGVAMGVAVRVLSQEPSMATPDVEETKPRMPGRVVWGMALNLLEPPAIAIALGLALSYVPTPLTATQLWRGFAVMVAPLMLLAAGGESLWMGATEAFSGRAPDESDGLDSNYRRNTDQSRNSNRDPGSDQHNSDDPDNSGGGSGSVQ